MNPKNNPFTYVLVSLLLIAFFLSSCGPANSFPLSQPGPYDFGTRQGYKFIDTSRGDRPVTLTVWYPAQLPKDSPPSDYNFDAPADLGGAPYPVILSSSKVGSYFGPHMASHGFVYVGVDGQDSSQYGGSWLVDYPLDIVFALNQVASQPLEGLEGMTDASRAGAMGYSFDSFTSLALGGARLDPDFNSKQCGEAPAITPAPSQMFIDYNCKLTGGWETLATRAGPDITTSDDGLWQPMTDDRILAVMPMGPEGAWLFGERGLAAVNRPVLIIAASEDDINYYDLEAVPIFERLGTPDKSMITFLGEDHMMIYSDEPVEKMRHFAAAFFGYYLQGQEKYKKYFSEDVVNRLENIAWGVYSGE
jgi:predicted dienelactone hydrolase